MLPVPSPAVADVGEHRHFRGGCRGFDGVGSPFLIGQNTEILLLQRILYGRAVGCTAERVTFRPQGIAQRAQGVLLRLDAVGARTHRIGALPLLRVGRSVQDGPDREAEADEAEYSAQATQRALPRTNSMKVPVGTPVGPLGTITRSLSLYAVPATSRCTHG